MSDALSTAPRGAIPNWRPATTLHDYLRNCREGLEEYSDRRIAQLTGWPRIEVYRAKLIAHLPDDLFEQLLAADITSTKELANISLAFKRGENQADVERCPHCGHAIRVRWRVAKAARDVISTWLAKGQPMRALDGFDAEAEHASEQLPVRAVVP